MSDTAAGSTYPLEEKHIRQEEEQICYRVNRSARLHDN
jgi:hypothetical protein